MFFGVPHKGLFIGDLISMLGSDHPRQELVQQLGETSELLRSRLADFKRICRQYGFKIASFYETRQSRHLKLVCPVLPIHSMIVPPR